MENTSSRPTLVWISRVAGKKKIYIGSLLFLQIILGMSGVWYAVILKDMIDQAVGKNHRGFFTGLAVFAGLAISQTLLRAINRLLTEHAKASMENRFKERLFCLLLSYDYGTVSAVHSGEWMNRMTSDTVVVGDSLAQIVPGVGGMLAKMVGALAMIVILVPIFAYVLIPGGILLIVLTYLFRKKLKELHKCVQEADGALRVFLQETLGSMLVVRAFVKEDQTLRAATEKMENHKLARMKRNKLSNMANVGFSSIMQGAYVLGAGICGYGILMGTMSYGTLMAILQLIGQVQSPFANITSYLPRYYTMLASAERLMEVEAYPLATGNIHEGVKAQGEIQRFYENDFRELSLEGAYFTYQPPVEDAQSPMPVVLEDVNLTIKKGEYLALTGPSGCGKSTILKLLMCLYPLDQGTISLNKQMPLNASYRRLFAYVPQGNHLMSGTIGQIVAFLDGVGRDEEDRIWKALHIACAKDFVKDLTLGLDTLLGEGGLGLSEGQMQRIAIARALYSDSPILMLDEATSGLDEEIEKQLLTNLRAMTDKTVLIVTHRSAVLAICDKEIMFAQGKVGVRKEELK